jgi:hypothetical protein
MPPTTNGLTRPLVQPIEPLPPPRPADLATEFVSGGSWAWYSRQARALPPSIDDITSDFGDDLYERMEVDPTIAKSLNVMKASILEDGIELSPAVKDEDDDGYDLAKRIRDEAEAMFDDLETSLDDVLWDMCGHISRGNTLAEQVYELKRGYIENRELLQLVALKPKPRRTYAFVVDAYLNVIGMLGQRPGESNPYMGQFGINPETTPNLLPLTKFAIATFRPKGSDPRGTSILRPAYDPWWRKRQVLLEYLKYIAQFAGPSIWGTTPEKAQLLPPEDSVANPILDTNGALTPPYTPSADLPMSTDPLGQNPRPSGTFTLSPEQQLLRSMLEFRNGTAAAFPFGTEIHTIEMQGEGAPFMVAKGDCDRDIIGAILTQTLATEEGQHQARAAAQVHQDVLDTLIRQAKRGIVRMMRRDVLRPWVLYNWGEKALKLVPEVSLGHTETQDLAGLITAMGGVGYTVAEDQLPEIDELLNLPVRDLSLTPPAVVPPVAGSGAKPSAGGPGGGALPTPPGTPPAVPAKAGMSDKLEPNVGRRTDPPEDVRYSSKDRRALLELFDDAFPEYRGLLDAKVADA